MSRFSTHSRLGSAMGLAALCLAVAGCSGGTPLRFALSTINGAAFSPRKDDNDRPLPNADVHVFAIGANGTLTPIATSASIKTDQGGAFTIRDLISGQTILVQVTGTPLAQAAGDGPVTVSALVPLPPPPSSDQGTPQVSARVDFVSDLAADAALRLIQQGTLAPAQISPQTVRALEATARQVALNNCLLPGQNCSGGAGTAAPSREDLINQVVQQAVQTPGVVTPPDTGGVGVVVH